MSDLSFSQFCDKYVLPYQHCERIYDSTRGFIVWRLGTGQNIELLHIYSFLQRRGYGRELFQQMLSAIRDSGQYPYHSVFGFTRVSNERAKEFYTAMGFNLQPVQGLYADGEAIMFWQEFNKLLEVNLK